MSIEIIVLTVMFVSALLTFFGFPGPLTIALAAVVYSARTDFTAISWNTLIIFFIIGIFAIFVDNITALLGAKKFGASKKGIIGAILGLIMVFVVGPIGLFIGPPLGAFTAELLLNKKSPQEAGKAALGVVIGGLTGILLKVLIALALIVWFGIIVF